MTSADMDVDSLLDRPGFCRLCVVNYDPGNMTEIFDNKDFGSNTMIEMIKTVTNIEVERNGLPTSICDQCVDELEKAHSFIQICVAGNNFLCNELFEAKDQVTDEPYIKKEPDEDSSCKTLLDMPVLSPQIVQRDSDQSDEDSEDEQSNIERELFDCAQCSAKFAYKANLVKHVTAGNTNQSRLVVNEETDRLENICVGGENSPAEACGTFECPSCSTDFTTKARLEKHVVRGSDVSCTSVAPKKSGSSKKDRDETVSPSAFYCFKCLAKYTDKDLFIDHVIANGCIAVRFKPDHIIKAYKNPTCPNCKFTFSSAGIFRSHIRRGHCRKRPCYTNKEKCFCPSCRLLFSSKSDLHKHLMVYQCEPPKGNSKFSCLHCQREFAGKQKLRKHFVAGRCTNSSTFSERVRKIVCIFCPDKFMDVDALRSHLRLKQCKKPLLNGKFLAKKQCPTCPTMFSTGNGLRKHLRLNRCRMPGPTSFFERQCPSCQMVFKKPEEVQMHLRLGHSKMPEPMNGIIRRQCPLCQAIFTSPDGMKKHLRLRRCKLQTSNWVNGD